MGFEMSAGALFNSTFPSGDALTAVVAGAGADAFAALSADGFATGNSVSIGQFNGRQRVYSSCEMVVYRAALLAPPASTLSP